MLVVLEGLDGVGKSTQSKLLIKRYQDYNAKFYHFPRHYQPPFGDLISDFLQGKLGDTEQTNAYFIALLFACDQFALMRDLDTRDSLVILDRYFYSNMAYQSAKLSNEEDRMKFRQWLNQIVEFFALPKPDILFYLSLPKVIMQENLQKRQSQGDSDKYEENFLFQEQVAHEYQLIMQANPNFITINCTDTYGWRDAEDIHREIVQYVDQWQAEHELDQA